MTDRNQTAFVRPMGVLDAQLQRFLADFRAWVRVQADAERMTVVRAGVVAKVTR